MKKMKRRKWPVQKVSKVLGERKRQVITVKKVCQKYDISFTQYYRWKKQYSQDAAMIACFEGGKK